MAYIGSKRLFNITARGDSTFIRYSASPDGAGFTDTWSAEKKYIGIYVGQTASEVAGDYTWCKFVGEDGDDNVYIAYAASADGEGATTTWYDGQNYIGIYTGTTEPTSYDDYTWCKFMGRDGQDGESVYIRFADYDRDVNWTNVSHEWSGQKYIGIGRGQYPPAANEDFMWCKFIGADGQDGADGNSVFIRYSAYEDGEDLEIEWREGLNYIGFATGETAPETKNGYTWCKFTGKDGQDGTNGNSVFIAYATDENGDGCKTSWSEGYKYIGFYTGQSKPSSQEDYTWCKFVGEDGSGGSGNNEDLSDALDAIIAIQMALINPYTVTIVCDMSMGGGCTFFAGSSDYRGEEQECMLYDSGTHTLENIVEPIVLTNDHGTLKVSVDGVVLFDNSDTTDEYTTFTLPVSRSMTVNVECYYT